MNLRNDISKRVLVRNERAFTMVEIAIALAVIAFALVAIVGILPVGLQTQRDNREETLINQDARLLIEAIRTGSRDTISDLGRYVMATNGVDCSATGITNLAQYLSDPVGFDSSKPFHELVFSSISGAVATRGTDLGFRYQVRVNVTNSLDFADTILSNQIYEVRLRFAWPVLPDNTVTSEGAGVFKARALVGGTYKDGVFFPQHYWNNAFTNTP